VNLRVWRHRVKRLLALSPAEATDLALAQWYLVTARARRRWSTPGRFMQLLSETDAAATVSALDERTRVLGQRLALAVERAAENGPIRATCLERAMAVDRLLRHHGVTRGRIRVGVRWTDGKFLAHAWVELDDLVLADTPDRVNAFRSIADARMVTS
jgi:hypothetical protein